jgi:hypothetical protein
MQSGTPSSLAQVGPVYGSGAGAGGVGGGTKAAQPPASTMPHNIASRQEAINNVHLASADAP